MPGNVSKMQGLKINYEPCHYLSITYLWATRNGDKYSNVAVIIQDNKSITFCFHSNEKHDPWGKQISVFSYICSRKVVMLRA